MPSMIQALQGVANMIRAVAQDADAAAKSARDAAKEFRNYRDEVEAALETTSRMDAASSASTGGMGARSGNTVVTSKGMAKAIAAARRSL